MLWRMGAEPHLDRIGIMLARLDNLPQRHRSVTRHAAAPDVDFRTSIRYERIPGRHDPCSRNFPSHACRAKPLPIGISLAEIAGIPRSWQRPARAGPLDWHNACGNCGNPRHGPPARYRDGLDCTLWVRQRNRGHQFQSIAWACEDCGSSEGSGVGGAEPGSPMTHDRHRH
jgi:hypothetical protein